MKETRIYFRCTHSEKRTIIENAKAHNYPTATFLRECGLYGLVQPIPSINVTQWSKLAGLANNVNQLTHQVHLGQIPGHIEPMLSDLKRLLEQIRSDITSKRQETFYARGADI